MDVDSVAHPLTQWKSLHDAIVQQERLPPPAADLLQKLCDDYGRRVDSDDAADQKRDIKLIKLTILQNFLQKSMVNQYYCNLSEIIIKPDLAWRVVDDLEKKDDVQGYLAAKCLPQLLVHPQAISSKEDILCTLIANLIKADVTIHNMTATHQLQVLQNIYSKKLWDTGKDQQKPYLQDLRDCSFEILIRHWGELSALFLSSPHTASPQFMAYLSLWKKLIKYTRTTQFNMENEELEDLVDNGLLVDKLELLVGILGRSPSVMVCNKILDLLNEGLPYGEMVSRRDSFELHHQKLAFRMVTFVNVGLLERVPKRHGNVGFGGEHTSTSEPTQGEAKMLVDHCTTRKLTLLILRACAVLIKTSLAQGTVQQLESISSCLISIWQWVKCEGHISSGSPSHWAVATFCEQDDSLVEAMLCLLDIFTNAKYTKVDLVPVEVWTLMNPNQIFLSFLDNTSHDHTVMIDLLASPETCFLLYFIKYLHYAVNKWSDLVNACDNHTLQRQTQEIAMATASEVLPSTDNEDDDVLKQLSVQVTDHLEDMTCGVRSQLTEILRKVSTERMRVTQIDVLKDVSISLDKLRSRNRMMETVLKMAEELLPEDTGSSGEDSEWKTKVAYTEMAIKDSSEDMNINETIFQGVNPLTENMSNILPTLTDYSDSEGEDDMSFMEEESIRTELVKKCSRYLDKASDCAALMSVTSLNRLPQSNKTKLIEYSENDSDEDVIMDVSDLQVAVGLQQVTAQNEMPSTSRGCPSKSDNEIFKKPLPPPPNYRPKHGGSLPSPGLDLVDQSYGFDSVLDEMMAVLIRLRIGLEKLADKGLFPYNALPLIKLLGQCETLYEQ